MTLSRLKFLFQNSAKLQEQADNADTILLNQYWETLRATDDREKSNQYLAKEKWRFSVGGVALE